MAMRYQLDFLDQRTGQVAATERFSFRRDELAITQSELFAVGLPMVLRCGPRLIRRFDPSQAQA